LSTLGRRLELAASSSRAETECPPVTSAGTLPFQQHRGTGLAEPLVWPGREVEECHAVARILGASQALYKNAARRPVRRGREGGGEESPRDFSRTMDARKTSQHENRSGADRLWV